MKIEYTTRIRTLQKPVLEYAVQVWHYDTPNYISDKIESLRMRALRIILPYQSYTEALNQLDLATLQNRRENLSTKFFQKIPGNSSFQDYLLYELRNN